MKNRDASYQDMTKAPDTLMSDVNSPCHNPPAQNEYEKAKWNSNGYDQINAK